MRRQCVLAELFRPIGNDVAVAGAAHRIFRDAELRRKGSGYAVDLRISPRRRCMEKKTVERFEPFKIRREIFNKGRVVKYAEQIPSHAGGPGSGADSLDHFLRHRNGLQVIGGKVHFAEIFPENNRQISAHGGEGDAPPLLLVKVEEHIGGTQGGVAAEVDLAAGSKPVQGVFFSGFDRKCSLRQIVFSGYAEHQLVREPLP